MTDYKVIQLARYMRMLAKIILSLREVGLNEDEITEISVIFSQAVCQIIIDRR